MFPALAILRRSAQTSTAHAALSSSIVASSSRGGQAHGAGAGAEATAAAPAELTAVPAAPASSARPPAAALPSNPTWVTNFLALHAQQPPQPPPKLQAAPCTACFSTSALLRPPPKAPAASPPRRRGPPVQPATSFLRLTHLPYKYGEEGVRQLLAGYKVLQVAIGDMRGRRVVATAYVQLDSPESARKAKEELHGRTVEDREISAAFSSEERLAQAKAASDDTVRGFVVRCRGFQYAATAQEVLDFLGPSVPVAGGTGAVWFYTRRDGRPLGEALVELPSEEARTAALARHRAYLGTRYIEVNVSSAAEVQSIKQFRRSYNLEL